MTKKRHQLHLHLLLQDLPQGQDHLQHQDQIQEILIPMMMVQPLKLRMRVALKTCELSSLVKLE